MDIPAHLSHFWTSNTFIVLNNLVLFQKFSRLKMGQYNENRDFSLISPKCPLPHPGSDTMGFWMATEKQKLIFAFVAGLFPSLVS